MTRNECHTNFVPMKNMTIALDEETARWVRIEAAKRGTSVSRLVGHMLGERRQEESERRAALERYMARPREALKDAGSSYPSRGQLYDRSVLR